MKQKIALVLILIFGAGLNGLAQTRSTPGAPTAGIVAATKKFLATLDDAQRGKVVFAFKDEAQRKRWSNLRAAIFKRQGLRMGDLTKTQREAALAVLAAAAYAKQLKRDLTLSVDGRKLELKLSASEFVEPAEIHTGSGIIQMEFSAITAPLAAGRHRLTVENRHLPAMSVYLINAAQPRFATVQITRQKRNQNQSAGEIEFTFHPFRPKTALDSVRHTVEKRYPG